VGWNGRCGRYEGKEEGEREGKRGGNGGRGGAEEGEGRGGGGGGGCVGVGGRVMGKMELWGGVEAARYGIHTY